MNIGKRIKVVRTARGITRSDIKDKLNFDIEKVETGFIDIKYTRLCKVCEMLNISLSELTAAKLIIEIED